MKKHKVFIPYGTESGEWLTLKGEPVNIPNSAGLKPIICTLKISAFGDSNEYRYRLFDKDSGIPLCLSFRKQDKEQVIKDIAYKANTYIKTPEALADTVSKYAESMAGYKTN
jgi:hypothetical protein